MVGYPRVCIFVEQDEKFHMSIQDSVKKTIFKCRDYGLPVPISPTLLCEEASVEVRGRVEEDESLILMKQSMGNSSNERSLLNCAILSIALTK